jgi:Tfp pilus assembly pilus retraction ATPase PilT
MGITSEELCEVINRLSVKDGHVPNPYIREDGGFEPIREIVDKEHFEHLIERWIGKKDNEISRLKYELDSSKALRELKLEKRVDMLEQKVLDMVLKG